MPASDLRSAVMDAVGSPNGAEATSSPAANGPRRLDLRPDELSVEEFELAGLVASGARWTALVYSPAGTLYSYRAGDRLADGVVSAVESTDVLLQTEEGPVRIPISVPAR
jgi:Tfp pilus assembly protein PilP